MLKRREISHPRRTGVLECLIVEHANHSSLSSLATVP